MGTFSHWDDLKAAMRRRFKIPGAKQIAHLQLTQIQQDSSTVEEYTSRFHHLTARARTHWDNDIMIVLYRRSLCHQLATSLCYTRLTTLTNAIHIAYTTED